MRAKILVVEDDVPLADAIRYALSAAGYEVAVAHNGPTALNLVETGKPDLVLLDALLPKMNGFDFCKRIRESRIGKNIPVIIMTGVFKQHFQEKEAKLKYGASDYLLKPFTMEKLEELLVIHLGYFDRSEITQEGLGFKTTGNLKLVPIEKLLNNIDQTGKTGMLQIKRGKMLRRIYFQKGDIVFIKQI